MDNLIHQDCDRIVKLFGSDLSQIPDPEAWRPVEEAKDFTYYLLWAPWFDEPRYGYHQPDSRGKRHGWYPGGFEAHYFRAAPDRPRKGRDF